MVVGDVAYLEGTAVQAASPSQAEAMAARNTRVARNIVVLLGSQIAVWIAGSGLGILIPRYLGDSDVGRMAFASSFVSLFALLVLFGSERYITREVARDTSIAPHIAFNGIVSRVPPLLLATVIIISFVHVFGYARETQQAVYVFTVGMWLSAIGNTLMSVLQGLERMTLTSVAGVVEKMIGGLLGVGAVILASQGMIVYSLILLGANALSVSIITIFYLKIVGLSWRFEYQTARRLFIGGAPFMVWGLALLIYGTIDITMLSIMSRDEVVGWYSTAYRFIGIATFIPFSITTALLPSISSAPIAESKALIRRCTDIVLFTTMPIAVFFLVCSGEVVHFLGYGTGFEHSVILMQILSLHIPLTAFTMIAGTVLIASNREGPRTKLAIAAALINPILNLIAIPYFEHVSGNGAIGAAIISVFIEIFMLVGMLRLLEPGIFARSNLTTAIRCAAAGVPMGAAMIVVSPFGLIAMMLVGGVVYLGAALAFGAISRQEAAELPRLVLSRGRTSTVPVD